MTIIAYDNLPSLGEYETQFEVSPRFNFHMIVVANDYSHTCIDSAYTSLDLEHKIICPQCLCNEKNTRYIDSFYITTFDLTFCEGDMRIQSSVPRQEFIIVS